MTDNKVYIIQITLQYTAVLKKCLQYLDGQMLSIFEWFEQNVNHLDKMAAILFMVGSSEP